MSSQNYPNQMSTSSLSSLSIPNKLTKSTSSNSFRYANYYNQSTSNTNLAMAANQQMNSNNNVTNQTQRRGSFNREDQTQRRGSFNREDQSTMMMMAPISRRNSNSSFTSTNTSSTVITSSTPRETSTGAMLTIEDKFIKKPRSSTRLNTRRSGSMTSLSSYAQSPAPQVSSPTTLKDRKQSLTSQNGMYYFPNGEVFTPRQQPKNRSSRPPRTQRQSAPGQLSQQFMPASQLQSLQSSDRQGRPIKQQYYSSNQNQNQIQIQGQYQQRPRTLQSHVSMPNLKSASFSSQQYEPLQQIQHERQQLSSPELLEGTTAVTTVSDYPVSISSGFPSSATTVGHTRRLSASSQQLNHYPTESTTSSTSTIHNSSSSPSPSVDIGNINDTPASSINCELLGSNVNGSPLQAKGRIPSPNLATPNYAVAPSTHLISSMTDLPSPSSIIQHPVAPQSSISSDSTLENTSSPTPSVSNLSSVTTQSSSNIQSLAIIKESEALEQSLPTITVIGSSDSIESTNTEATIEKPGFYLADDIETRTSSSSSTEKVTAAKKDEPALVEVNHIKDEPVVQEDETRKAAVSGTASLLGGAMVDKKQSYSSSSPSTVPLTKAPVKTQSLQSMEATKKLQQLKSIERKPSGIRRMFRKLFGSSGSSSSDSTSSPLSKSQRASAPPAPRSATNTKPNIKASRFSLPAKKSDDDKSSGIFSNKLKTKRSLTSDAGLNNFNGSKKVVPLTDNVTPGADSDTSNVKVDIVAPVVFASKQTEKDGVSTDIYQPLTVNLSDVEETEDDDIHSFVIGDDRQTDSGANPAKKTSNINVSKRKNKELRPSPLIQVYNSNTDEPKNLTTDVSPTTELNGLGYEEEELDYLSSIIGLGETSFFEDDSTSTNQEKLTKRKSLRIKSLEKKKSLSRNNTINSNNDSLADSQSVNTKASTSTAAQSFELEENDYDQYHYKHYKERHLGSNSSKSKHSGEDEFEIITSNSRWIPVNSKATKSCLKTEASQFAKYKQANGDPKLFSRLSPNSSSSSLNISPHSSSRGDSSSSLNRLAIINHSSGHAAYPQRQHERDPNSGSSSVSFSNKIYLNETYSATEYDRFNLLLKQTYSDLSANPSMIKDIRSELNSFKRFDMGVHELSRQYTHFFRD